MRKARRPLTEILAENVKEMRLRLELSQADLGRLLNVGQSHIARIEMGQDVRISTVGRIADALAVDPPLLLSDPHKDRRV